ncbi:MAG: hypothetical protein VW270_08620 [Candidatus Poseidoniales archaeon]
MKYLIAGASVSAGFGIVDEKHNPNLWANQFLIQSQNCTMSDITNVSVTGMDNSAIFRTASTSLIQETYDTALICWQNMPRTCFNFGLETYQTRYDFCAEGPVGEINLVGRQTVPMSDLKKINKVLLEHYSYHWDIVNLVAYVNIILQLAKQTNTKIYFVNFNLPWQTCRFFDKVLNKKADELDTFTKEVLQVEMRDDEEIEQLYELIHAQYAQYGGIQSDYWLNLYEPLRKIQVDNSIDQHPGIQSQDVFSKFLLR